jgi:hypothetical protein
MNKHKKECQLSWIAFPHTSVENCTFCNPSIENQIADIVAYAASGFICNMSEGFGCSCNRQWRDKEFVRTMSKQLAQEIIKKVRGEDHISFCPETEQPKPLFQKVEFDYYPTKSMFVHVESQIQISFNDLTLPYEEIYEILKRGGIDPMDDLIDQLREFDHNKEIKRKKRVSFECRRIVLD